MKDVATKMDQAKDRSIKTTGAVNKAAPSITAAAKSYGVTEDYRKKLTESEQKTDSAFRTVARELMGFGITLEDFKESQEAKEAL